MIKKKELKTIDYDLEEISKELQRQGVIIPIVVEILIKYFGQIYFLSNSKNKRSEVWNVGEKKAKKKWSIFEKQVNPKVLKLGNEKILYRKIPKIKKILSIVSDSGKFNFGNGLFVSIDNEKNIEEQLRMTMLELKHMPVFFPKKEMLKVDYDGTLISWINPSIKDKELTLFNKKLREIIVDESLEESYFPYVAFNSWRNKRK